MAHSERKAAGQRRHWVFVAWVAMAIAVAAYIFITAPLADYFHHMHWMVAVSVPALMFFFLAIGLGWLVYMVTARREGPPSSPPPRTGHGPRLDVHRPPGDPRNDQ